MWLTKFGNNARNSLAGKKTYFPFLHTYNSDGHSHQTKPFTMNLKILFRWHKNSIHLQYLNLKSIDKHWKCRKDSYDILGVMPIYSSSYPYQSQNCKPHKAYLVLFAIILKTSYWQKRFSWKYTNNIDHCNIKRMERHANRLYINTFMNIRPSWKLKIIRFLNCKMHTYSCSYLKIKISRVRY